MKVAIPDLISPSYFPAIAAVDLGLLEDRGLNFELELVFPVTSAAKRLAEGEIDFLGGAAHAPLYSSTGWNGSKLLAALSQNMYWFLVARADLAIERGDLSRLAGLRIGAAPGPDLGLLSLFAAAGIDIAAAAIEIQPIPGASAGNVSFGVTAAEALAAGSIDAFWANGMGAEVALLDGVGTVVVDARRGDGPPGSTLYTFPALMTSTRTLLERPEIAVAVTRAVMEAQRLLKEQPDLASGVGQRLFPKREASLIAELIRRDSSFYLPRITEQAVDGLNGLAAVHGLLAEPARYFDVVSSVTARLWTS